MSEGERRLAAIMFTDMVGYTALGQRHEYLSLALVEEQRKLIRPILSRHGGKEIKTMGDAFLVEFPNALEAVRCAYDIQRATREFNFSLNEDRRIHLRIGVHLGDIVESAGDISGDAVNVASRIESLAEDGGVCLTSQVFDQVRNKFELPMVSLGVKPLKNVTVPIEVHKMVMPWTEVGPAQIFQLDSKRIAILPFANVSPDPNDEYFAEGLTDELIDRISHIGGLEIIARTSVMAYKNKEKRAAEIGKELKVGTLVEGSVRKAGSRIRVTAQFIDVKTEGQLWSSKYDKNLEDIFEVQSDIAERVAVALQVRLLPDEASALQKKATENTQAYIMYLKGRYYWNERSRRGNENANKYFEEAIHLDPNYALAYVGLADSYATSCVYGWMKPRETFPKVEEFAKKAIDLDPKIADAHATLAAVYSQFELNPKKSEIEYKRAIELNPSYAMAHHWYSILLVMMGRLDDAYYESRRARELDPLSPLLGLEVAGILVHMERLDEAEELMKNVIEASPDFAWAHQELGLVYLLGSRTAQGIDELRKAVALQPGEPLLRAYLGCALGFAGMQDEARAISEELERLSKDSPPLSGYYAAVLFSLRRIDEAFEQLDHAIEERAASDDLWNFLGLSMFKEFRDDMRWTVLEKRKGLQ